MGDKCPECGGHRRWHPTEKICEKAYSEVPAREFLEPFLKKYNVEIKEGVS